jgi:3-oxoacyl-[acyl-carrier-protein] synthase-3
MAPSIAILGTGSYAPAKVLTNHELARMVETTDEWITTRTGIRERRIAAHHEPATELAIRAAIAAIADARLTAADIDLLVLATITPDMPMPSSACIAQRKLSLPAHAVCFDLNAACSGFLYALEVARALMAAGRHRHALVIGAEKLSSFVDWQDRSTCVLFGDAAGAVVLGRTPDSRRGILGCNLGADGGDPALLCIPGGGSLNPPSAHSLEHRQHFLKMKGREVYKFAVRVMAESAREILEQHALTADQIACVISHQANRRIIEALAGDLGIPLDRFVINLDRYGNTSAASVPIALDEAWEAGRFGDNDLVLLNACGGGLTWGASLLRW